MFDPDATNRDKEANANVQRDEKEKLRATQSSNDDAANQTKKVPVTADNSN
jgi:hypothetical protein